MFASCLRFARRWGFFSRMPRSSILFPWVKTWLSRCGATPISRKPIFKDRAREKLAQVGLEHEYEKMPADLSGGMRKRAGLARALALDPSILLVDEPSAGLDPMTSSEIDNLLLKLKSERDTTLVVVTHNIPSARRIGDEFVVLHEGHFIAQGTAEELDRSEHAVVRAIHAFGRRRLNAFFKKLCRGSFSYWLGYSCSL